jgi:hypothetical protein
MSSRLIGWGAALFSALAAIATGQTPFPFQLLVTEEGSGFAVQNGAQLTFNAPIGQTRTAQVRVTYTGTAKGAIITSPPQIFGSNAFSVTLSPDTPIPVTLAPGDTLTFTITYKPSGGALNTGQLSVPFSEFNGLVATPSGAITLVLQGTAPSFSFSYILQSDLNVVPLQPGGSIVFPVTPIKGTSQASLNVTNRGSGTGTITGITITGSAFKLSGLPLFPSAIPSGQNLAVLVVYSPTGVSADTGQVTVTFDAGSPVTFNLQGNGSSSSFVYQLLQTDPPTTVAPGDTISLPDTNVGQTSSVVVRVLNTGNASGTVSSVSLIGQGFQLSNPPILPQTLATNASLTFTVTFAPAQPGTLTGRLIVNSDTFPLSGVGLGPQLTFSYVAAGTTITLSSSNNSVVFSPVPITQSAQLSFDVKNTGTLPATISNIGVGQTNSPYSLSGLPPLPLSLAPNSDFHFTIAFTPVSVGFSNGTLQIDTTTVGLVGSGTPPPPLSAYTIVGPTGNAPPQSQPIIGLTLQSSYPVALAGNLTLSVSGNLPADPAVQFATGGLTVPFVIPANSTSAVFGNQGTQIGIQTGTVASTIAIAPSFATRAGNVDLTPNTPAVLKFNIAPAPPTLIAIQLTNQAANSLVIAVTGFTTTRTLTAWNVQFTTAPGFNMPTSKFTIDLQSVSTVWFRSTASQTFGGQFTLTIPFTFQGTVPAGQSVLSAIASVSVTMSNELGASNSIQTKLQ